MTTSRTTPSTSFFGPNRRYQPVPGNNVRPLATVFNLQPGDAWNPAWETEILTPRLLVPHATADVYIFVSAHFLWALHWRFQRTAFIVRQNPFLPFAFQFNPVFAVNSRCINELKTATGTYAFDGTATISWTQV